MDIGLTTDGVCPCGKGRKADSLPSGEVSASPHGEPWGRGRRTPSGPCSLCILRTLKGPIVKRVHPPGSVRVLTFKGWDCQVLVGFGET